MRLAGVPKFRGNSNVAITREYVAADFAAIDELSGLAVSYDAATDTIKPFDVALGFDGFINSVDLNPTYLSVQKSGLGVPVQTASAITGAFGIDADGKLCEAASAVFVLDGSVGQTVQCKAVTGKVDFECIAIDFVGSGRLPSSAARGAVTNVSAIPTKSTGVKK